MTDRPPTVPDNAVVVPGPSLYSEGLTRSVIGTVKRATEALAGAADALRSLKA